MDLIELCCLCRINCMKLMTINDDGVLNIKTIILKHFWFIALDNNKEIEQICQECWTKLRDFHDFFVKVEQAYKEKSCSSIDIKKDAEHEDENVIGDIKVEPLDFLLQELQDPDIDDSDSSVDSEKEKQKKRKKSKKTSIKSKPKKERKKSDQPTRRTRAKKGISSNDEDDDDEEKDESKDPAKEDKYDELVKEYIEVKCHVCLKQFDSFLDLKPHCLTAHNEQAYVECCNKKFKKRGAIYRHLQDHKFPEKFCVCEICNKRFKARRLLQYHKKEIHTPENEKQFSCDKCHKRFFYSALLKQHKLKHDGQKFKCPIPNCKREAVTKSAIDHHIRVDHSSNTYICDICSKEFKSIYNLKYHAKTHQGIEKKQCNLCGVYVVNLKAHMTNHVQLQLKCPECDNVYATKSALASHIKYIHRAERKFKCDYCEKAFKKEYVLKEHIAGHTGDYLYTCNYCSKTFNSSSNMYRHKKRDHPEEWQANHESKNAVYINKA